MKFTIEGTTADKRLIAYGGSREELFENAALGMFSEIVPLEDVGQEDSREFEILGAPDLEGLLVEWLNELLYCFDSENFVCKHYAIVFQGETRLRAKVSGSRPASGLIFGEVKAATYHELSIVEQEGKYQARIILDV